MAQSKLLARCARHPHPQSDCERCVAAHNAEVASSIPRLGESEETFRLRMLAERGDVAGKV